MTTITATEPWRDEWGAPLTRKPWPQYVTAAGWEAIDRVCVPHGLVAALTSTAEAELVDGSVLVTVYVDVDGTDRFAIRFKRAPESP